MTMEKRTRSIFLHVHIRIRIAIHYSIMQWLEDIVQWLETDCNGGCGGTAISQIVYYNLQSGTLTNSSVYCDLWIQ